MKDMITAVLCGVAFAVIVVSAAIHGPTEAEFDICMQDKGLSMSDWEACGGDSIDFEQ